MKLAVATVTLAASFALVAGATLFTTPVASPHLAGTTIAVNSVNDLPGTCTAGHFTRDGITFNFCSK